MNQDSIENYKMVVISNGTTDGNLSDGEILEYGKKEEYDKHVPCLIDFCKDYYPEISIFKKLTVRHTPQVFAYFLQDLGNIIFLNTTTDSSIKKYGKTGMFVLTENLTENQKESLQVFAKDIDEYRVSIIYNLELVDGMVGGSELHACSNEDKPISMINAALNSMNSKEK